MAVSLKYLSRRAKLQLSFSSGLKLSFSLKLSFNLKLSFSLKLSFGFRLKTVCQPTYASPCLYTVYKNSIPLFFALLPNFTGHLCRALSSSVESKVCIARSRRMLEPRLARKDMQLVDPIIAAISEESCFDPNAYDAAIPAH